MSPAWILVIVLIVLLLASPPYTGWHTWGWGPSGIVAVLLVVVLVLLLVGRL